MPTNSRRRSDPAIDAAELSDAERAAVEAHERVMTATNSIIGEGHDPRLVAEGLATTAASALVQTHGVVGAARVLLACYAPIRAAAVAIEAQVTQH